MKLSKKGLENFSFQKRIIIVILLMVILGTFVSAHAGENHDETILPKEKSTFTPTIIGTITLFVIIVSCYMLIRWKKNEN